MLKKHMAACLVVTAFAAAPALAQTSTTPSGATDRPAASGSGSTTSGSSAMQPGAAGAAGSATMNQGASSAMGQGGMQGQFMTQMQPEQIMASELIGTRVVSANNESIGDINDVIVDRNGQVMAAVVGVGGFLGIGEKDVAVPFKSLEFANSQQAQAMDSSNSGNAASGNVATTGSTATTGNTATTGSGAAGSTNMAANNNAGASGSSAANNQPERVVLRMTKAELQAAPAFNSDASNTGGTTTGSAGNTTAPKQ
ncbi:PRC-barrel domain-containing protein [Microvirga aerilata]|uniref:PRC-barrel domain-containing protein n=1 Tax=Microvirga aerilata TaxID=670292 RepID=A0A936Z8Y6_9HYPH|nr:PRC-barrel domain-containing protein [Microvirga aerilata]MBL0405026.1 PRC-barrel domain-containing protein [Microvirga aerilata]